MTIFLYILGVLLILMGMVGLLLPAMPGAPLIFSGLLSVAWADGFTKIGWKGLLVLGILTLIISLVDYVSSAVGARRSGASVWGVLGAFLGLLVGLPFAPLGIILGPLAGALLLEYLKDPDFKRAARVGIGTLIGFIVGTVLKYTLAFCMLGIALVLYLF